MSSFDSRPTDAQVGAQPWGGRVLVSPGHALYVGPAGDTRLHRHHALQLVVGQQGSFGAAVGREERLRSFQGVLIGSDVEHRIDGGGLAVAIYYVDGSSGEGRAMAEHLQGRRYRDLDSRVAALRRTLEEILAGPHPPALDLLRTHLAGILGHAISSASGDSAVDRAIAILEESLASPPSIPELARRLDLRQRVLSRDFRRETGLSIRRYLLWLRLKAAVTGLGGGGSLTEAAQRAGFADAAHLTRTFVQMFGVVPSASLAASEIEVLDAD